MHSGGDSLRGVKHISLKSMADEQPVVTPESVEPEPSTPLANETTPEKSEEAIKLEAKKVELEEQVRGLEGTVTSLKEDIVRKREERKGVDDEEQQPVIDTEALLAQMEERVNTQLQPVLKENEVLRKAVLKSNEEALKAKKTALDSINARIASATAATSANQVADKAEPEVELSPDEARIAKELGLKNPRYMKEVEVL